MRPSAVRLPVGERDGAYQRGPVPFLTQRAYLHHPCRPTTHGSAAYTGQLGQALCLPIIAGGSGTGLTPSGEPEDRTPCESP